MNRLVDHGRLGNRSWTLSQSDFEHIAAFAREHFGLSLAEAKKSLIQSRLSRRMTALNLTDFSDYLARLIGEGCAEERQELLSVLTTNVTHFFREDHHFDALRKNVLPALIAKARAGGRVRLWSAGCSTGQEAYSMAMIVIKMCPEAATLDFKILATDIDPVVVKQAKEGIFSKAEIEGIPDAFVRDMLMPAPTDQTRFTVSDKVMKLITFRVLNLIEPLPMSGPFDVIFCRNVTIYFDRETQAVVWGQLCAVLGEGAYLFIGHSERISGPYADQMLKEGFTAFRKG